MSGQALLIADLVDGSGREVNLLQALSAGKHVPRSAPDGIGVSVGVRASVPRLHKLLVVAILVIGLLQSLLAYALDQSHLVRDHVRLRSDALKRKE